MPVLSAVLTLRDDPVERATTLSLLSAEPRIDLGPMRRDRLPVVLATETRLEDKVLWRRIERLPGVAHVELVFADFSDLQETACPERSA